MTTYPTYPKCPDCGGNVVPRPVLPQAKVPPIAEFVCMKCNAAFHRENQQLVKIPGDSDASV